ncbi:MAG: hydrogenase expression/formation protein HypE, partial [Methylococcales bacterium]|nr:hydrogenase expression/formation protein HypE [Methylococcales bacterium]
TDTSLITLAHGNGGELTRTLIEQVFARHLHNACLDIDHDAATLPWSHPDGLIMTTDSFTVEPLIFPGGDIGSLAVHGTVNDLAVAGAKPRYLSLNAIIEEGLPLATLEHIVASLGQACRDCGVAVVTGDTKVVRQGQGGGLYLVTTGIGERINGLTLGMDNIAPGDVLLISGSCGDHGAAVLLAREQFGLRGALHSDAASVLPVTEALTALPGLKFMRDPTRGGVATVLHDIARSRQVGVCIDAATLPIKPEVQAVTEMLGYDPLYLACEGRVLAVLEPSASREALTRLHDLGYHDARCIGHIESGRPWVRLITELGGERLLEPLASDPLPRIC